MIAVEHIPKDIKKLIGNKMIEANIYKIQYDSAMGGYFCMGFINFILY